jgi:peptide/nickel transport system substrate-binding protein
MKYLTPIEKFMVDDVPVIPTVYYPDFDEYNTQNFSGWPTPTNAYESSQPPTTGVEVVLLHLVPR